MAQQTALLHVYPAAQIAHKNDGGCTHNADKATHNATYSPPERAPRALAAENESVHVVRHIRLCICFYFSLYIILI